MDALNVPPPNPGSSSDDELDPAHHRSVKKRIVREMRGDFVDLTLLDSTRVDDGDRLVADARDREDRDRDREHGDDDDNDGDGDDGERRRERHTEHHSESVGTMSKSKDARPSTKKRKGAHLKSLESLFSSIELNADYYNEIKNTESRCELGAEDADVREVDREAFGAALVDVEQLIREHAPEEASPVKLALLSLAVIQFLVDMGAVTSSTATTGLELTHSLTRSTSQTVNKKSEVIESSPYKKHPRRSTDGDRPVRCPSQQPSNDPPKRQRKYEMDEVSSKPLTVGDGRDEADEGGIGVAEENLVYGLKPDDTLRASHDEQSHASSKRDSAVEVAGPGEGGRVSETHDDRRRKVGGTADDRDVIGSGSGKDDAREEFEGLEGLVDCGDRNETNDDADNNNDDDVHNNNNNNNEDKPTWRSSLVCADTSLSEVASRIYGPLLASLRAAGLLDLEDVPYGTQTDDETFESLVQSYALTTDESQNLGDTIYTAVENVYIGTYDLRNVNVAQKALAVVAEAFHLIIKEKGAGLHVCDDDDDDG